VFYTGRSLDHHAQIPGGDHRIPLRPAEDLLAGVDLVGMERSGPVGRPKP
jgi:hypothetical protein